MQKKLCLDPNESTMTSTRGLIYAIGGRESAEVLEPFVSHCGGPASRLIVLSTASDEPERKADQYRSSFRSLGVDNVSFLHPSSRADANASDLMDEVDRADAIFFTGGNQLKLVSTLGGTLLEAKLHQRHHAGLHLGGTSAGAAAMSAVMIARGRGRSMARLSSLRMSAGFGFLRNIIVDQHFRERDRYGRLLAAVLCNPSMLGFGLDENTAFAVDTDNQVTVYGKGALTIVDGLGLEATDVDEVPNDMPAGFTGMRMHSLTAGWTYDLNDRRGRQRQTLASTSVKLEPDIAQD